MRGAESVARLRMSCADLLDLVMDLPHRRRKLLDAALARDVHEVDFRLIEEEMIVQGGDGQAVVERGRHGRIDFIFEDHGIAHHHRLVVKSRERGPGPQPHKRRQFPAVDRNVYVVARNVTR